MSQIVNPSDIMPDRFAQADTLTQRKESILHALSDIGLNRPLKVLIATNSVGCGGQEHQVMRLIPELRALGFEVEHLYYGAPHTLIPKYEAKGIQSVFIDKNELGQFRFWKRLVGYLRKNQFDIIHAFGGTTNIYVKGAAILAGCRTLLSGSRNRSLAAGGMSDICMSFLNLFSNVWVVNSQTNIEGIDDLYYHRKTRAYVLPNALEFSDRDYLAKGPLDPELKKWIDGRLIVASVGRFSRQKNFDLFLDLAKKVHEVRKDVCFCLVGEPSCTPEGPIFGDHLEKRIQDENLAFYVKLTGRIDEIAFFLPNIDILVSTSHFEGCPNVVLEAMRAALPIVMTNSCDTDEIIRPGENGFVVEVDELEKMAEHVIYILSSKEVRGEFGRVSKQMVEMNFSAPNSAWILAKIYINELARRNGKSHKT